MNQNIKKMLSYYKSHMRAGEESHGTRVNQRGQSPLPKKCLLWRKSTRPPASATTTAPRTIMRGRAATAPLSRTTSTKNGHILRGSGRKIPGLTTEYSYFRIKTGQEKSCPVALYAMDGLPFYRMKFITP